MNNQLIAVTINGRLFSEKKINLSIIMQLLFLYDTTHIELSYLYNNQVYYIDYWKLGDKLIQSSMHI